jgi:hypothetical protein
MQVILIGNYDILRLMHNNKAWGSYSYRKCTLPDYWFKEVRVEPLWECSPFLWKQTATIPEMESEVALAFNRIPANRQAELLTAECVAVAEEGNGSGDEL